MVSGFIDSAKKVLSKRSSPSKATSNHPLQNDKSCDVPEGRYRESPKEDTTVRRDVPSRTGAAVLRGKDANRTPTLQPIRETMPIFPRKETTPPRSTQRPSYRPRLNSMHEFPTSTKEKKELQGQSFEMQDNLDAVMNVSERRKREIGRLQKEVQRLDSLVISMVSEKKEAGNKIYDLETKVRQQEKDIRQQEKDIQDLQQKLRASEEQHSQAKKLLEDRTAELKGAQAFLTTADRYSGADIIKMAETLNGEIFQVSAMMAEMLVDAPIVEDFVQRGQYIEEAKAFLHGNRKLIGSRLFDYLVTKSTGIRVDPLPLQLAFQALLSWWCVYEVDRFCEGPAGKSLKQIYRRIHQSEIQAVAGRWRVMTSVQTMNSDTPTHAEFVFEVILALMHICGWFKSDTSQRATLSVQQAVFRVERMWKILKAAIMQEITAAEITIFDIAAGSGYNTAEMDDMYTDTSGDVTMNLDNGGQQILCTVGVGLQRGVSKRSENGTMQIHREVILKPKVALTSVLLSGESLDRQMDVMLSATDGKG